jgi:hypothetical protein
MQARKCVKHHVKPLTHDDRSAIQRFQTRAALPTGLGGIAGSMIEDNKEAFQRPLAVAARLRTYPEELTITSAVLTMNSGAQIPND